MIKAAFFDIDGTLLSHRTNSVPASARRALAALRQKGVLVFVATGRQLAALGELKQLEGITFDGAVTLNGQYCRSGGKLIYADPLDRGDIAALLAHLEKHPIPCGFVEEDGMYLNFYNEAVFRVHGSIHSPPPPLGDLNRGLSRSIYQATLYATDAELEQFPPLPHTAVTRWAAGGVDMIPATGGKGVGIEKMLAHYEISPGEAIAFGDGDNDIDMFRAVGIAVAMGNADDAVKAASSYVTADVDDDGILRALTHFGVL